MESKEKCEIHNELLAFYCDSPECRKLVCPFCLTEKHQSHPFSYILAYAKSISDKTNSANIELMKSHETALLEVQKISKACSSFLIKMGQSNSAYKELIMIIINKLLTKGDKLICENTAKITSIQAKVNQDFFNSKLRANSIHSKREHDFQYLKGILEKKDIGAVIKIVNDPSQRMLSGKNVEIDLFKDMAQTDFSKSIIKQISDTADAFDKSINNLKELAVKIENDVSQVLDNSQKEIAQNLNKTLVNELKEIVNKNEMLSNELNVKKLQIRELEDEINKQGEIIKNLEKSGKVMKENVAALAKDEKKIELSSSKVELMKNNFKVLEDIKQNIDGFALEINKRFVSGQEKIYEVVTNMNSSINDHAVYDFIDICKKCSKYICIECNKLECATCKKRFCKKCQIFCPRCNDGVCTDCIKTADVCPKCGKSPKVCQNCTKICTSCWTIDPGCTWFTLSDGNMTAYCAHCQSREYIVGNTVLQKAIYKFEVTYTGCSCGGYVCHGVIEQQIYQNAIANNTSNICSKMIGIGLSTSHYQMEGNSSISSGQSFIVVVDLAKTLTIKITGPNNTNLTGKLKPDVAYLPCFHCCYDSAATVKIKILQD